MACTICRNNLDKIYKIAGRGGHLQCLIWARKVKQYPWHIDICFYMAKNGHLDCLMWAYKNGCPWDEYTLAWVASNGHLDCLIWARNLQSANVQYIWYNKTFMYCNIIAENGHLDCLIWAHKNWGSWDDTICNDVKQKEGKNRDIILKWIHTRISPLCDCMKTVYIFWDEWKEKGQENCNICLEVLDDTAVKFVKCTHHYHKECMDTMLNTMIKKHCSICERTQ